MTDKVQKIEKWIKEKIACWCNESQCEVPELPKQIIEGKILALREMLSFINSLQEEPVSDDLESAADKYSQSIHSDYFNDMFDSHNIYEAVIYGAKWQKEKLWKPADGDDLPEYEREVVVFTQNFPDDAGIMSVAIGHRPNPDGWDGKSLSTGKVEHYTPKTYDKGGWNIPDVKFWLDAVLPNMED